MSGRLLLAALLAIVFMAGEAGAQSPVAAPNITSVTPGDGALTIAWTAPADVTGITAYDLRYIATADDETSDANWTVVAGIWSSGPLLYVLPGLSNNTSYDVQLRAFAGAAGAWSTTSSVTPAEPGGALITSSTLPLNTPLGGMIERATDADLFKFELTTATAIVIRASGDLDSVGELLDADGELILENDDGNIASGRANFLIGTSLDAGTYYVRVTSYGGATGSYVLHTETIVDTTARTDAQSIEVAAVRTGIIDQGSDEDWYTFTLSKQTTLIAYASGAVNATGSLLNSAVEPVSDVEELSLPGTSFLALVALDAGTYYIKVTAAGGQVGGYVVGLEQVTEPGSTTATALPLPFGRPVSGSIEPATDADYLQIETDAAMHVRISAAGAAVDLAATLLDEDGQSVDANLFSDIYGQGDTIAVTLLDRLDAGTHYLKLTSSAEGSGSATGRYVVLLTDAISYDSSLDACMVIATALSDPLFGCQWHLRNTGQFDGTAGEDINVEAVWAAGKLGDGATVAVVDDGLDYTHKDLKANVIADLNHDYTGVLGLNDPDFSHGTNVAGIIAAAANEIGVRGVAPRAKTYGLNLTEDRTDLNTADAMTRAMDTTAVSNNSWGPSRGRGYAHAPAIWELAVERGVTEGYGRKGVFYVWAAGNAHPIGGYANLNEYANHYSSTAVCAVNDRGVRAGYSETGANLWVCAPSADPGVSDEEITTTTSGNGYTRAFNGTSASAPIVSGVAALLRAAHNDLTWRDVKLILAGSARKNDSTNSGWNQGALEYGSTAERYDFNHEYGFGVVDAKAAMDLADNWTRLPDFVAMSEESGVINLAIPNPSSGTPTTVETSISMGPDLQFTEFVAIDVTLEAPVFRDLRVELVSPSGAVSRLTKALGSSGECARLSAFLGGGACSLNGEFRFGSARHLGEDPAGDWKLRVSDRLTGGTTASLTSWRLTVYGHRRSPGRPAITSLSSSDYALSVAWTTPANVGASDLTAYDLRYIESDADESVDTNWTVVADVWTTNSGEGLAHTISGLSGLVPYDVQVRAVNNDGDGLWSDSVIGIPGTPAAATIDSLTPGDESLTVAWSAPTDTSGETVASYKLRYLRSDATDKADAHWTVREGLPASSSLEVTLTGLVNGVAYDVQVRAVTANAELTWSPPQSAVPRTLADAPLINSVTSGDAKLTVRWSAPASDGGATITAYDLRTIRSDAPDQSDSLWTSEPAAWTGGAFEHTLSELSNGVSLDIQVRAVNAAGNGPWSATRSGTPRTLPGRPVITSATATDRTLTTNWDPPADNGGSRITSYDLRYIRSDSPMIMYNLAWDYVNLLSSQGADLTYTIRGLTDSMQYDLQVRARNAVGNGDWSDTWVETTAVSADATLSALTLGGVPLAPRFDRTAYSYTAAVGYTVTSITIAGTGNRTGASLAFLDADNNAIVDADTTTDGLQVGLNVGGNVITIKVTAPDRIAVQTYTITVTRTEEDRSLSPSATDPGAAFASTASYDVQFQGSWNVAAVPDRAGRPRGARFTWLVGAVHNAAVTFLASGERASAGVKRMAEVANTDTLESEVQAVVDSALPNALALIRGTNSHIRPVWPETLPNVEFTTAFPRITLATKIDPSHDWFVGVSGLLLLDGSGRWLRSHEADLFPWDAGTEEGDDFSRTPNVETTPRGVITSIRGTGPFTTERMASLTFTLQSVRTKRSLLENTGDGVDIGLPVAATASSGTVSYTLGGPDAASFNLDTSTGQLWTKAGVTYDYESKSNYTVSVTVTDTVGAISTTVDITVANIDEPPEITGQHSIELAENRTGAVATYRARDPEGEPVTWLSLGGPDSGAFRLSTSGVLTFRAPPNYEDQAAYDVTLRASADGELGVQTGTLDVTITVTDVDEPADISFAAAGGVAVNSDNALAVDENHDGALATFSASDPEQKAGLTYTWSLGGSDRGDFNLSAAGALSFAAIPDHERPADAGGNNVYDITVNALDSDGKTGSIAVAVTVDPVNELPAITGDDAPSIEEGSTLQVGTYRAADPESATIAWQPLVGSDSDRFEFNVSNGRLGFKAAPDYEDAEDAGGNNVYDVTLSVSAGGHTTTLDVAVTITNRDETGTLAFPSTRPQEEAAYTATLSDADGVVSTTWTWERSTSRTSGWAAVSGAVDGLTTSAYTPVAGDIGYYLRATAAYEDGHGPNKGREVVSSSTVRAKPVVNTPPAFADTTTTRDIPENAGANAAVGARVTATDTDSGDTLQYELEPESDLFTIDSANGQIRVKAAGSLDYDDETARSHTVTVKASDSSNAFDTIDVTITVTDVNEPPEAVADSAAVDEDDSVTIDVLNNDSDPEDERSELLLTVVTPPLNGRASVNEPASAGDRRTITYEPNADYHGADTFTYRVRDAGSPSLSSTATVSVEVDAVNDAPTFASPTTTRSVSESTEAGDNVGAPVTATDVDENDMLTYSLSGPDAFSFVIDAAGQIAVGTGVTFDAATTPEYAVTVEARDRAGASATIDVTITVTAGPVISGGGGGGGGGGPSGPSPSSVDFEWNVKRDIESLDSSHDSPTGSWSNGSILWLLENGDGADDAVYAYDLETGERVEEREFELDERNRAPRGVWSDGKIKILWVSDSGQNKLFAHDLESGERLAERDIALAERNRAARGIWSDGETMWVLDGGKDSVFVYDLESGLLLAECALDAANNDPRGIWSDGVTVWVSDHGAKRLFAYRLPVLSGEPDADEEDEGDKELERVRDEEFPNTILSRASNNSPRGLWSDGDVMYVADASDGKVYSYNMPDAIDARLASLRMSGIEIGEFSARETEYTGVAAEGVAETTVEAAAVQSGAGVVIDPPDADGDEANGHQVALEGLGEITVTVTSADGSRRRSYRVALADPEPEGTPEPWTHCLRGDIAEGFSLIVYEGGSVEELVACAESRSVMALYALHEGVYVSYILGAPEWVNAGFAELFPGGVPPFTPLTVKSNGPPSADPNRGDGALLPGTECLRGEIAVGFSLVIYQGGGSVEDLVACAESRDVVTLYALQDGEWISYILGAPEWVNEGFAELFPDGISPITPLVAKGPVPTADASQAGAASR